MLDVQKIGAASTLDIVDGVKKKLPQLKQTLPPGAEELNPTILTDQSIFVSASIQNVVREAIIAACLTALMILLFLSSWRSTLIICVSIPLSILCSIVVLSALGETINIMTLGGMALAVGILVFERLPASSQGDRFFCSRVCGGFAVVVSIPRRRFLPVG